MTAELALDKCLGLDVQTVLDVGCGKGVHSTLFRKAGKKVTSIDLAYEPTIRGDFLTCDLAPHDLVWCSHVLEHQVNPGLFLKKCFDLTGKYFCVTVPPLKNEIVGGHVTLWNAGLLLYHLILAGFDCSQAKVRTYGYNISVLVEKKEAVLPPLKHDFGDIEALAHYFPIPVINSFNGVIQCVNWP